MKTVRNDACPCGSGKKYKKCCLSKDMTASVARPGGISVLVQAGRSTEVSSSTTRLSPAGASGALAPAKKAPESPPPPPDPISRRADQIWQDFKSQSEDGRIAIFLETLNDAEVMVDDTAFEFLSVLHTDAVKRGDRSRFSECVVALRERLPDVYDKSGHYYLSWQVLDALAENRLEVVAPLSNELAARAGDQIDIFNRTVEALAYHGQLPALVSAFRIARSGVKSSTNITGWAVAEFNNRGIEYEIFDYLENIGTPVPDDLAFLEPIRQYVDEPRQEYLSELIKDLAGTSGREWQADDFALRPRRQRSRDEWDEDDDDEGAPEADPAARNLSRLTIEFVGYLRREEGVSFPRGRLAAHELYSYFIDRHHGRLDPRPSMLEQMTQPNKRLPKPPRPAHPLCPERVTLEAFLAKMLGPFSMQVHVIAAVFQAMPAWLRFLESRRMIDADLRRKVASELSPLHTALSPVLQTQQDDPTLARQQELWPADAAKEPAELVR
jgi:SEC-C motif